MLALSKDKGANYAQSKRYKSRRWWIHKNHNGFSWYHQEWPDQRFQ
jgi:hypothetical protein